MENNKGGKRFGAGRKPFGQKKEPITVYAEKELVIKVGTREKARDIMYDALKNYGNIEFSSATKESYDGKSINPLAFDEVGQYETPKGNYFDTPQEEEKRTLVRTFEQWVVLKKECVSAEDWASLADEIRNSNLYDKQKALLLKPF